MHSVGGVTNGQTNALKLYNETFYKISSGMDKPELVHTFLDVRSFSFDD